MNIYYIIASHFILPKVNQYVPEYMFDDFLRELVHAHYENIDITLMERKGAK